MTYLSDFLRGANSAAPGAITVAGTGAMKASIILFDSRPGTRNFTVPANCYKIRRFVVGAGGRSGGGYEEDVISVTPGQVISYTVGAAGVPGTSNGGTSSFGGVISATGGGDSPGVGSGGLVSTSGGLGGSSTGGGASGHRFGNGGAGAASCGGGWSQGATTNYAGGDGGVDGFGLGLIPGRGALPSFTNIPAVPAGYGGGGAGPGGSANVIPAGIGGGAGSGGLAGIGGGCGATGGTPGNGAVGVEVLG